MTPSSFEHLRRHLRERLGGLQLTPIQAGDLRDIIAERTVTHVDESGPMPENMAETMARLDRARRTWGI